MMKFVSNNKMFGGEASAYVLAPHVVWRDNADKKPPRKELASGWIVRASMPGAGALRRNLQFNPERDIYCNGSMLGEGLGVPVASYDKTEDAQAAIAEAIKCAGVYEFKSNSPRYTEALNWACGFGPLPEWASDEE